MLIAPSLRKLAGLAVVACAVLLLPAQRVEAAFYNFTNISNNSGISGTLGGQFTVEVTDGGSGTVLFKFTNAVGTASSITDIYFQDPGGLLSNLTIDSQSSGVSFGSPASPGDLPGGNSISPAFVTTGGLSADSNPPAAPNGINSSSEFLVLSFNGNFANVINALDNPISSGSVTGLRIGLHVQAIGTSGQSDAFITGPGDPSGTVPVPPSVLLMAVGGLGALGLLRRQRKPV